MGLVMTESIALHLEVYGINHQSLDERIKNKKTLKGLSKFISQNDIKHDDYVKTLQTNAMVKKQVVSMQTY
jgi:hypothetical protein